MALFSFGGGEGDFESAKSGAPLYMDGGGVTLGAKPDAVSMPLIIGAVALVLIVMLRRKGK